MRSGALRLAGAWLACGLLIGGGVARAQTAPPWASATGLDEPSYLTPKPLSEKNPLINRSPNYAGIAVSDWVFYPNALVGAVYNDNLTQVQTGRTGAAGVRLQGDITGVRDTGVARTTVYGEGDAYIYPSHPAGDTYDGRAGVAHVWELQRGLTVKAQVEFDQLSYPAFGGLVATPGGGVASLVAPQKYRQIQASAAVQKSAGRYFIGASVNETATFYDALATSVGSLSQDYRDSAVATLTQRGGYWVSPMIYAYGETSQNWRNYVNDPFTSHGYRAVAGLGSDRIGLFRGEVYGGFQEQFYTSAVIGDAKSPAFGGKLFYYLTRVWTLSGSLDQSFSDSSNPTPSNPLGDPARVTATQLNARYQLDRSWSAQAFGEYDLSRYLGVGRVDDTWTAGVAVDREIARNLNVKVDYRYLRNLSNEAGSSFVNNILGATALYKF